MSLPLRLQRSLAKRSFPLCRYSLHGEQRAEYISLTANANVPTHQMHQFPFGKILALLPLANLQRMYILASLLMQGCSGVHVLNSRGLHQILRRRITSSGRFSSLQRLPASMWKIGILRRLAAIMERQELVSPRTITASGLTSAIRLYALEMTLPIVSPILLPTTPK